MADKTGLEFFEHLSLFSSKKLSHCEIFSNLDAEFKAWKKKKKNEKLDHLILKDVLATLREKEKLHFHERTKRFVLDCPPGRIHSRIEELKGMSELELDKLTNKHLDKQVLKSFNISENIKNIEKNKGNMIITPEVIFGHETDPTSSKINVSLHKKVDIQNRGKVDRVLKFVSIIVDGKQSKSASSKKNIFDIKCGKNVNIPAGGSVSVVVRAHPKEFGVFKGMIAFEFNGFGIGRFLSVRCGDPDLDDSLKKSSPPVKKVRKPKASAKPKAFIPAPPMVSNDKAPDSYIRMGVYAIPRDLYDSKLEDVKEVIQKSRDALEHALKYDYDEISYSQVQSYKELHELLLWYEEIELRVNMQQYNMPHATLTKTNGGAMWRLLVPGLAEKRPSVMIGDTVLASGNSGGGGGGGGAESKERVRPKSKLFQGKVNAVGQTDVLLYFDPTFDVPKQPIKTVSVEFEFPRRTMKILHQGLDLLDQEAAKEPDKCCMKVLYPTSKHVPTQPPVLTNHCLEGLNKEQTRAVLSIVQRAANIDKYASPYVIFGPPGTGKTHTVVASVKMLTQVFKPTDHFLITAPSNTAADLLLTKLSDIFDTTQMFRLMSFNRHPDEVSNLVKSYCNYDHRKHGFTSPSPDKVKSFKIIVATNSMAGKLYNYGITSNWFKVVVVDEAGHAWETETLTTFATQQEGTLVILAGDPRQLGPVTHSDVGKQLGLGTSLLERLLDRTSYTRNLENHPQTGGYNSNCVTKLVACYRCHPNIIHIPNQLFYDGDLIDATSQEARLLVDWEGLEKPKFPLIFHNLQGENEQEGSSPSWFNQSEALQALDYVTQLTSLRHTTGYLIGPEDIGIIAPYQKQVKKIKSALAKKGFDAVMVGSCEQFQGQERKVIIISTVRTAQDMLGLDMKFNLGFVSNPKRMNVAMTRAKALLIVIGCAELLRNDKNWGALIDYCIENNAFRGELPPPPSYPIPQLSDERAAAEEIASSGEEEEESEEAKTRKMLQNLSIDPNQSDSDSACVIS